MAAADWGALAKYNPGGSDMNMDWLNNTMAGRSAYGSYLKDGGQSFDGATAPNYGNQASQGQYDAMAAQRATQNIAQPYQNGANAGQVQSAIDQYGPIRIQGPSFAGGMAGANGPMPEYMVNASNADGHRPAGQNGNLGLGAPGPYQSPMGGNSASGPGARLENSGGMYGPGGQLSGTYGGGGGSGQYMGSPYGSQNPYLEGAAGAITNRVTGNLQRNILPGISQASAMSGNYGGSRQGVLESNAMRDANLGLGDSLAGMYSQDWNGQQNRNLQRYGMDQNYATNYRGQDLSRYGMDQNFYTQQRGQDQSGVALGANLYGQGQQGQWNALNNASGLYNQYTGLGNSTQTQNTGGGVTGALGGGLAAWTLANNIWK